MIKADYAQTEKQNMDGYEFSVILPVHNEEKYIGECPHTAEYSGHDTVEIIAAEERLRYDVR